MPSPLTLQANQTNQRFNNLQFPLFPLRWCALAKKWLFVKQPHHFASLKQFLLIFLIVRMVISSVLCGLFILTIKYLRVYFKLEHVFVTVIITLLTFTSVVVDLVIFNFGWDILGCCNWCYRMESFWQTHSIDSWTRTGSPRKLSVHKLMFPKIGKGNYALQMASQFFFTKFPNITNISLQIFQIKWACL